MGLFGSSKSSTSTSATDDDVVATDNATAIDFKGNSISGASAVNIYDPKASLAAIQASKDQLSIVTDLLDSNFSKILSTAQEIANDASSQVNSTRDFASSIINKGQETSDDRLIKTVGIFAAAVLGGLWLFTRGAK